MAFSFTQPNYPNAALGIDAASVAAISLQRQGRGSFALGQAAAMDLAPGTLNPSFLEPNILDEGDFASAIQTAVVNAGLMSQKRWSVSLPGSTARSAIITLEAEPSAKQEAEEVIDWKAEQTFGTPAAAMRLSRQRISPNRDGKPRYFLTAITLSVLDEYELVFEKMGWTAGLILPRAVGEANWLMDRGDKSDALLISSQSDGFTALLLRRDEPTVVRTVTCSPDEIGDEIYRLLMFYNDRFGQDPTASYLERLLLVGKDLIPAKITEIAAEALGRSLRILRPEDVGLNLPDQSFTFDEIAAPAALAALA